VDVGVGASGWYLITMGSQTRHETGVGVGVSVAVAVGVGTIGYTGYNGNRRGAVLGVGVASLAGSVPVRMSLAPNGCDCNVADCSDWLDRRPGPFA
jgi:hypothetical protein